MIQFGGISASAHCGVDKLSFCSMEGNLLQQEFYLISSPSANYQVQLMAHQSIYSKKIQNGQDFQLLSCFARAAKVFGVSVMDCRQPRREEDI